MFFLLNMSKSDIEKLKEWQAKAAGWLLTNERFQAAAAASYVRVNVVCKQKGGPRIKEEKPFLLRGVIKVYWKVRVVGLVWSNGKDLSVYIDLGRKSNTSDYLRLFLLSLPPMFRFALIRKSPPFSNFLRVCVCVCTFDPSTQY